MTWIDQLPRAAATRASSQHIAAGVAVLVAAGGATSLPHRKHQWVFRAEAIERQHATPRRPANGSRERRRGRLQGAAPGLHARQKLSTATGCQP